jgi:hypothetical protein
MNAASPETPRARPHVKPWYRQFWPWFLIAIPFAGVVTASITGVYAFRHADVEVHRAEVAPLDKTSWESHR